MSEPVAESQERTRVLADGSPMPTLGLGVWQMREGPECEGAVRTALELGYRHIDTAQAYRNEESVGRALRDSGVPREEVFITTKLYPRNRDPAAAMEQSLRALGVDQVDLYIVHWPEGGPTWAWPGMEEAHRRGYARSIGVSNFSVSELEQVIAIATIEPVLNQVQFSPFEYRRALLAACREHQVVLEAYSPLGTGRHLSDPTVARIAKALGRTPAQVLLRWCLQRDTIVIAKSTHRARLAENFQLFDFTLSPEDLDALDALDRGGGSERALERSWW
jgi:2,5-diketo-D-gluconate reductase A